MQEERRRRQRAAHSGEEPVRPRRQLAVRVVMIEVDRFRDAADLIPGHAAGDKRLPDEVAGHPDLQAREDRGVLAKDEAAGPGEFVWVCVTAERVRAGLGEGRASLNLPQVSASSGRMESTSVICDETGMSDDTCGGQRARAKRRQTAGGRRRAARAMR